MAVKKCSKCGLVQPATTEFFYKQDGCAGGLRPDCKSCVCLRITSLYKDNPEKFRAKNRAHRLKNREKAVAYMKAWNAANAEKHRADVKAWRKKNRPSVYSYDHNARARRRGNGGRHTSEQIVGLFKKQKARCVYCGISIKKKFHRDHIVPSYLGGSNDISNIQLLCPSCNCRKSKKHPEAFAREIGLLI